MNIVYEYSESVADGIAYFYGLNRTHNSEGEIYVYNAHGDVVQLVKDNSVVASYTYDAFGNLTSQIGESDNPFLYLLSNGYEVKPLTRSSTLSGMTFEQVGGFKVNWGGDRMLSYHPATGSHHGGAYYKISSGAEEIARVFLRGDS